MASIDFRDFYIRYKGHPKFRDNYIIEDDVISVIIQKYEMILFTNKGEVLGLPNFGCDLERFLFQTKVSSEFVEEIIRQQIQIYIPELIGMNYKLEVSFAQDLVSYQESMFIYFTLADYEVFARIGDRYNASF
jgi:hypothetical protein